MSKTTKSVVAAVMAAISLPIMFVVVLVSPIYLGLFKALRRLGIWRLWRTVGLFDNEITFSWSCKDAREAEASLASAVSAVVDIIHTSTPSTEVASMRFVNPESGMILEQHCLRRITSDFGPESARLLLGNHVEHGLIVINGELRLENLNLDLRSPLSGHFSVELPLLPAPGTLSDIASRHGFQHLPAGPAGGLPGR